MLEIKHVDPVVHTEFMFDRLVLDFANGTTAALNTLGTADNGSIHLLSGASLKGAQC